MKKYEAELKNKMKQAEKVALAALGFAIIAQRKVEKAAKDLIGKNKAEVKGKAKKIISAALAEQKVAQKKLESETKKALAIMIKESKKQLGRLEGKVKKK